MAVWVCATLIMPGALLYRLANSDRRPCSLFIIEGPIKRDGDALNVVKDKYVCLTVSTDLAIIPVLFDVVTRFDDFLRLLDMTQL